ncbi:hypothetical protein Tco_0484371, partial [Tanacetum coccineum]
VTAGASTAKKSIVVLQGLLDSNTLAAEVGVTTATSVPFVTSSVIPTPEHEGGGHEDSIIGPNLSSMSPPPMLTAVVTTTIIADVNSALVPRAGTRQNVTNDSALDDPNICLGVLDHLAPLALFFLAPLRLEYELREAEAMEAIHLCSKIATIEAIEAAQIAELNGLKEQSAALGLTNDLLSLKMSFGELTIKAASLVSEKDGLVSALESTCSGLHELVSGYELFEEQIEAVQDEQVKIMSDKVAGIDADLMEMALHLHEEFYPRFLTTIVGRRWILSRGLKLMVMKRLQSPEYLTALGELSAVPLTRADYVSAVSALRDVDFPLLAQLASHKDASMSDVMDFLCLEGPAVETPEAVQLQPSPEQVRLPIHRSEDQVVIEETSLSFSLDVIHASVQRTQGDAAAHRSSLFDAMIPRIEPLSAENLSGEASTSGVPAMATTTALSATFIQTSSVPLVFVADYEVSDVGPSTKVPSPPAIVFEKETLETTLEHGVSD